MKHDDIFWRTKAAMTALAGAFSAAFGWLGWLLVGWLICMVADYISGSAAAIRKGEWNSKRAHDGLWHKAGMIFAVGVSGLMDMVLRITVEQLPIGISVNYVGMLLPLTLCWYILTELGSILENAHAMGAALPGFLVKALEAAQEHSEHLE